MVINEYSYRDRSNIFGLGQSSVYSSLLAIITRKKNGYRVNRIREYTSILAPMQNLKSSLQTDAAAAIAAAASVPSSTRSVFRRRDNHISQAITCLCISIIPWAPHSPVTLARRPCAIFYPRSGPATRAHPQDQPDYLTAYSSRLQPPPSREREGVRDGVSCSTYNVNQPNWIKHARLL